MNVGKIVSLMFILVFLGGVVSAGTLSIDTINFEEAPFGDSDKYIKAFMTVDGDAENLNVIISPDRVEDETGERTKESITVKTRDVTTWADYPIVGDVRNGPKTIRLTSDSFALDWKYLEYLGLGGLTSEGRTYVNKKGKERGCLDANNDGEWDGTAEVSLGLSGPVLNYKCAVKEDQLAAGISDFQSANEQFEVTYIVEGGERVTTTLSNNEVGDGSSAFLHDNIRADFEGAAETGENPPDTSGVLLAHSNEWTSTNGWRVIDSRLVDDWRTHYQNNLESRIDDWDSGEVPKSTIENEFNSRAREAIEWVNTGTWGDRSYLEFREGNINDGSVELEAWRGSTELLFPSFDLTIGVGENGYVEIEELQGEPRINSVSEESVTDTTSTSFDVKVENIGDARGQMEVRVKSCESPANAISNAQYTTLDPGQTDTLNFLVGASSTDIDQQQLDFSCTFEATDTNSQLSTTSTGSGTLTQNPECDAGERFRSLDTQDFNGDGENETRWTIKVCGEEGLSDEIETVCNSDQVAESVDGTLQCVTQSNPDNPDDPGTGGDDNGTGNFFGDGTNFKILFAITGLAMAIVGGIIAQRKFKIPQQYSMVGALSLGLVLVGLTFMAFWISVLAQIGILIIVIAFGRLI